MHQAVTHSTGNDRLDGNSRRIGAPHPFRRWLLWLAVIAGVWMLVAHFSEVEKLTETLARGQWEWIVVAAALQLVFYTTCAALYHVAFAAVGVKSRVGELLPVWFASLFVNVAAPAAGAALFIDDAAQRGQSPARAAAGAALVRVADFGTFALILVIGLVQLYVRRDLKPFEIGGAAILLLIVLGWAAMLVLSLRRPAALRRLLSWVQERITRVAVWARRPSLLADDWASRNACEFSEAAAAAAAQPRGLALTFALALATHVLDLATLYVLFLAFNEPIELGTLIAGFAVGVLFWIVSITPEGIGVVEGVMALVYASLGVPVEKATVVALAFRGLTFWLPLGIGFFLLRRVKSFGAGERSRSELWGVRIVALLTAALGIVNLLSAVMPALQERLLLLAPYLPGVVRHGARLTAGLAGFALLLTAANLWRRKKTAWQLALALLVVSAFSHLLKGLDYEEALLATGLAVWLWLLRHDFHARSDRGSARQGLIALATALLFTLAYGAAGFYLLDRHFQVSFSLVSALRQTVVMFTQFYDPGLEPVTRYGRYFVDSIYVVGAATLGFALLMLFRPVLARGPATDADRARARTTVEEYGRSSLARFTLFDDKRYFFTSGGSMVAYTMKGRVALALGDPIGPADDAVNAIRAFQAYSQQNDWQPAFYQTLPEYLEQYQIAGFQALLIGNEAVVELGSFTLEGGPNKSLRSGVHRLEKLGYKAEFHEPPLPDHLLLDLRVISDEWLTMMHGREKRFSLGWFDEDYVRNGPVMLVRAPDGLITAFANIVPEYRLDEITIDLMRRRREVERGTMDFLFVRLFEWARARSFATFNLGLSPLAGVGEQSDDPAVERALHYIYEHMDRFYNFKGLHQFKEKFHPRWSPRYLIYSGPAALPAVAMAIWRADSGDDFLWEYVKEALRRRAPKPREGQGVHKS